MTSHRDDNDAQFQATIDALSHSSITTKLAVVESLESDLATEHTNLETQRNQLHRHKQKIASLVSDLKSIQSGEEYTVDGGGGGSSTLPPGKVIYVDASYAAGSDDGSREKPYASLAVAIDAKCAVDDAAERIFDIAAGTYTVSKTITKDAGVTQSVTFRGRGSTTILQAGASFAAGKASDCLRLSGFASIKVEDLAIRYCKYGLRVACEDFTLRGCFFAQCGCDDTATQFDNSLSQGDQATAYAATTDGGALRVDSAAGFVRVEDNYVSECNRGLRIGDSVLGGSVKRNHVQKTLQAGIYLSSSTYTGSAGVQNFHVSDNQVINACNGGILVIGGRDNIVSSNIIKGCFNTPLMCWHCVQITLSDNVMEKSNFSTFNGQGVLGDAWSAGIMLDGDDDIYASGTYQAKLTGNVITEPSIGRAAAIYAIRIANDPFLPGGGSSLGVYCQANQSHGAATHVQNDNAVTILDMDSRGAGGVFSAAEKVAILADVATLQTAHPITPVVIENLSNNDNTTLQATDRVVFFKHSELYGLICTLPSSGVANGHTIYIKNLQTGSNPVRGWGNSGGSGHAIKVVPGDAAHKIDMRFDEITLEPSNSTGVAMDNENESARLVWLSASSTWVQTSDSY